MDIQPRRVQPAAPPETPAAESAPSYEAEPVAAAPPPAEITPVPPVTAMTQPEPVPAIPTLPTTPVPEPAPALETKPASPEGLRPDLIAQAEAETKKMEAARQASSKRAAKNKHSKGRIVAVLVAVIISLSLAGVATYAYMQSQGKGPEAQNQADQGAAATVDNTVDSSRQTLSEGEFDEAIKMLDQASSGTDEEQEVPASAVDEQMIGL